MYTCTILVPHVDTPFYLHGCIRSIRRFQHPEVRTHVLVADQSRPEIHEEISARYRGADDVTILPPILRLDAGYPIDVGVHHPRAREAGYFCSLDCDAFAIHKNWLYVPIRLIERYNAAFVGSETGLGNAYKDDKNLFFHVNNYFRVSYHGTALRCSDDVGFMRPNNREKVGFVPRDDSWGNHPCDNGVIAQWYAERIRIGGPKISLAINHCLGRTTKWGLYGMVIDDLVLHMVFGYGQEWIADMRADLGDQYVELRDRLVREGDVSDELLDELVKATIPHNHPRTIEGEGGRTDLLTPEMSAFIDELKAS